MAFATITTSEAHWLSVQDPDGLELGEMVLVYLLDPTTSDLCKEHFPWTGFRSNESAVELHLLRTMRIAAFCGTSKSALKIQI